MHLNGDELETAVVQVLPNTNSTEIEELTATEDREIVGYSMDAVDVDAGSDDGTVRLRAFIGSNPNVTNGGNELAGKFFASGDVVFDGTQGLAYENLPDLTPGEGPYWDWNEDAALQLEAIASGSDAIGGEITVYYREAGHHGGL